MPGRTRAPAYRADIDGLRALAVMVVVLFHSGIPGLAGGYAGVDVFFVISGYLITQLLEQQSRTAPARRALANFYLRRIRRILPALFATCLVTLAAALLLFMPGQLPNLGKYLAATPLLLSNAASWTDGGYFAPASATIPLSHLWSIAVEEQFYLLYPVVLLSLTRYLPSQRRATLLVLAAVSLALCIWASRAHPAANYFLAPTRAWELLLGAALALGGAPRIARRLPAELLAVVSLLCIALAVHVYTPLTPYPGTAALAPCAATAALIATGEGAQPALVNRLLAWRPLVFIGLISYSLYLWHRPLLVFAAYCHIEPLGPGAIALVLAATVMVAAVSWRFIERPIRSRALLKSSRTLLLTTAAVSVLILVAGLLLWNSNGFPQRFPTQSRALLAEWPGPRWLGCLSLPLEEVRSGRLCSDGPRDGSPGVLVWGDSHALALMPAYEVLARSHHMRLYFAAIADCPPLLDAATAADPERAATAPERCARFNAAVLEAVTRLDPRLIILAGRWIGADLPPGVADITTGLAQTVMRVENTTRSVCVVLGVPALKYSAPYARVMARRRHIADDFLRLSRAEALGQYSDMERKLRALAQRDALRLADPKDALCPGSSCLYQLNGRSLYFDDNHLSPDGARYVAPTLESCFGPVRPGAAAPAAPQAR